MNAIQFIQKNGVDKTREVVEGAPSNAESYQGGYYLRTKPEFQFHNGFHPVWNLTDNDGEWFKKDGFDPVVINDLKMTLESIRLVEQFGGLDKAKLLTNSKKGMGYLKQAIADYESIYTNDIKIEVSFGVSLMSPERVACIDLTSVSPTSDTIDDSDLEYHVSKNCKVIDYD